MTPDQVEACAKRAYEIFAANTNEAASWDAVKRKHEWADVVRSHEQNPDAIRRNPNANLQERCVAEAYSEMHQPAAEQPLVVPPPSAPDAPAPVEAEPAPASEPDSVGASGSPDPAPLQTSAPGGNDKKGRGNKAK